MQKQVAKSSASQRRRDWWQHKLDAINKKKEVKAANRLALEDSMLNICFSFIYLDTLHIVGYMFDFIFSSGQTSWQ